MPPDEAGQQLACRRQRLCGLLRLLGRLAPGLHLQCAGTAGTGQWASCSNLHLGQYHPGLLSTPLIPQTHHTQHTHLRRLRACGQQLADVVWQACEIVLGGIIS